MADKIYGMLITKPYHPASIWPQIFCMIKEFRILKKKRFYPSDLNLLQVNNKPNFITFLLLRLYVLETPSGKQKSVVLIGWNH